MSRPQTVSEVMALPVGPAHGSITVEITEQDRRWGYVEVRGKRVDLSGISARCLVVPVAPDVVAEYVAEDQILGCVDEEGIAWSIGKYADGTYYRRQRL